MKADRPLDEVYADIKEILQAWVVWISHLSSYISVFVPLHFFCPLTHAIETYKLAKEKVEEIAQRQIFCNQVLFDQPETINPDQLTDHIISKQTNPGLHNNIG